MDKPGINDGESAANSFPNYREFLEGMQNHLVARGGRSDH